MKFFLIACALFICIASFTQTQRLEDNEILKAVYPNSANATNSGKFNWSKSENGGLSEYRTSVQNIFYYKVGSIERATAVLASYDYTSGQKASCHGCTPTLDVVTFQFKNNKWATVRIKKDWEIPQPGFGEGANFQFKKLNNINCLYSSFKAFYNGRGEYQIITYYNIETFKEVKSTSKKISD